MGRVERVHKILNEKFRIWKGNPNPYVDYVKQWGPIGPTYVNQVAVSLSQQTDVTVEGYDGRQMLCYLHEAVMRFAVVLSTLPGANRSRLCRSSLTANVAISLQFMRVALQSKVNLAHCDICGKVDSSLMRPTTCNCVAQCCALCNGSAGHQCLHPMDVALFEFFTGALQRLFSSLKDDDKVLQMLDALRWLSSPPEHLTFTSALRCDFSFVYRRFSFARRPERRRPAQRATRMV